MKDCFEFESTVPACFTFESEIPDCFEFECNPGDEEEPPVPLDPEPEIPGFEEIKSICINGTNNLTVVGKYKATPTSILEEVIASVLFIESFAGGISKIKEVSYYKTISELSSEMPTGDSFTYSQISVINAWDYAAHSTTIAIYINGNRIVWINGYMLSFKNNNFNHSKVGNSAFNTKGAFLTEDTYQLDDMDIDYLDPIPCEESYNPRMYDHMRLSRHQSNGELDGGGIPWIFKDGAQSCTSYPGIGLDLVAREGLVFNVSSGGNYQEVGQKIWFDKEIGGVFLDWGCDDCYHSYNKAWAKGFGINFDDQILTNNQNSVYGNNICTSGEYFAGSAGSHIVYVSLNGGTSGSETMVNDFTIDGSVILKTNSTSKITQIKLSTS